MSPLQDLEVFDVDIARIFGKGVSVRRVAITVLDVLKPGASPRDMLLGKLVPSTGHDVVNEFLRQLDVIFRDV